MCYDGAMKNPLTALAESLLHNTTTASGESTLPGWLIAPLAIMADQEIAPSKPSGWVDENVVRKAIALYRAASARSASPAAVGWQFSPDGLQAVQVLPPPADSVQGLAFEELGRRLASVTMNHPRLAPVLERAMRQGYPFLAARIGEGFQSLTRRLDLPLPPQQALQISEQVMSALEFAHYRGLLHGAFDLHDVFVNERGQVSLLGVGVEQLRESLGAPGVALVSSLLPPEIASGAQPPDKRTDVFAMGALLYVLLTGRVPAAGQQIELSQSLPDVPAAVDGLMTRALAVDPDQRYPSLTEMYSDLRVALRARRAVPRPSTPAQRSVAPARKASPSSTLRVVSPPAAVSLLDGFPEPMAMPVIDFSSLEQTLKMPEVAALTAIEIPPAPEMPKIDWATLLQPVDLSSLGGPASDLSYASTETLATDPLVAAMMAVKATESVQQSRQRATRRPPAAAPVAAPASQPVAAPASQPAAAPARPAKPRRIRRS